MPDGARRTDRAELEDLTRDELIELLTERSEAGIKINFAGKSNARKLGRRVRPRVVRTVQELAAGDADSQVRNLILEGDNLQAMATLYRDRGEVDVILTDPPYNTGNDWRYNDRWDDDPNDPGLGELVSAEDGAKHTKWMKFMLPRLQMMRQMLKPSGVLAICIDHRELFHLGQMLNEVFREENLLAIINWQKSYSPRSDKSHVSTATEYVLVYAKDKSVARTGLLPRTTEMNARYRSADGDPRPWKSGDATAGKADQNLPMVYGIQSPFTGEIMYPQPGTCWRQAPKAVLSHLNEWAPYKAVLLPDQEERARIAGVPVEKVGRTRAFMLAVPPAAARRQAQQRLAAGSWPKIYFGQDGMSRPQQKNYLDEVKRGIVPTTYWADDDFDDLVELGVTSWSHEQSGHSQSGVTELDAIVGLEHGFNTVKPLKLFEKILQLWCPNDGYVLDPFAGSGTAGHAVLRLNDMTGSTRRFTLIEQGRPERGDSYARSLTAERLKRIVTGDWASGPVLPLPGGFRFATLDRRVDAQALLNMERAEMTDTVIASHFDATRRRGVGLKPITDDSYKHLVARNTDDEGFFLIWDGPNGNTDFDEDVYEECAEEAARANLKPTYHVYARLYLFQTSNVIFYQIPDRILRDFGLDMRGEPFSSPE